MIEAYKKNCDAIVSKALRLEKQNKCCDDIFKNTIGWVTALEVEMDMKMDIIRYIDASYNERKKV